MKRNNHRAAAVYCWLGLALGSIASAAAAGGAGPAGSTPGATYYRVVNIGPGDATAFLNARDQVAFSQNDPFDPLPSQAWFYDGRRFTPLGKLGGDFIRTTGLNDAGQVSGVSDTATGLIHSFIWSHDTGTIDIGTLPGYDSAWEPAINNKGVLTGYAAQDPSPPYPRAFRWSAAGGMEDLGVLVPGPDTSAYGRALNDGGTIAGDAWAGGSDYHAFAWTRATGIVDIDTLGSHSSTAAAVDAKGNVAGNRLIPPDNFGSVFWWSRATGMRNLGTAGGQGSYMVGMSASGRIVGVISYPNPNGPQRAMTWTRAHGMRDLGALGGQVSNANAANNKDQVVGGAETAAGAYHAFLWTHGGGMVDLNKRLVRAPAGLELISGLAINDNGAIVAVSNAGLVLLKPVKACGCGHAAGPIAAPELVQPGAAVDASLAIAAGDTPSRYTVKWSWGDGSTERARAAEAAKDGAGPVSSSVGSSVANPVASSAARHSYAAPGIYTISAEVTDAAGNSARVGRRIVVADTAAGALAGTGAVLFPAAADPRWRVAGGKARFGFVTAPAAKGAAGTKAGGEFLFSLPGVQFASKDARVVAASGTRAQVVGTGTLNGLRGYRFTATVLAGGKDGGQDGDNAAAGAGLGLRIVHTDARSGAEVVDYDSGQGRSEARPLAEGRIVMH